MSTAGMHSLEEEPLGATVSVKLADGIDRFGQPAKLSCTGLSGVIPTHGNGPVAALPLARTPSLSHAAGGAISCDESEGNDDDDSLRSSIDFWSDSAKSASESDDDF